jgi:hypothetical protein
MAAGDITWFRYVQHGGEERPVGPNDEPAPAHHSHYSFIEKIEPKRRFVLVRMEQIGEPMFSKDGQSIVHVRLPWFMAGDPHMGISMNDIVEECAPQTD